MQGEGAGTGGLLVSATGVCVGVTNAVMRAGGLVGAGAGGSVVIRGVGSG